jgi:hypothetical protein
MEKTNIIAKIICRKCNGPHFTAKCGKEQTETIVDKQPTHVESNYNYKKNGFKVKISNLPSDLLQDELNELLIEWGDIIRCKLLNYVESSCAYVEFINDEQRSYFIDALDKTPFDHQIIKIDKLDS